MILIPNKEEIEDMFKFRYKNYLKHNYIEKNNIEKDLDEYDDGRSTYFIAKINNRIIGSARLIRDNYLPTEKDCFEFQEPIEMKKIPRNQRAEISRLIVEKFSKSIFLPPHLVMLGIFASLVEYSNANKLTGGYSIIKKTLFDKLNNLKFPIHLIKNYQQIYKSNVLKKYFSDKNNPVCPIFFLLPEIRSYLEKIFNNRLLFRKITNNNYFFKNIKSQWSILGL